ncbi:hypothetical protein V7O66_05170 [Methanolobus sp. ZRKC3]|uniref:hypothetical protein n=1 Tax=Methanolobus sp. ZRKC3 TaxID=3125786 RepID=UPI00325410F2
MFNDDTDIEDEILYYLRKYTKMRTEELIAIITQNHLQTINGAYEIETTKSGYSRSTIIRTLNYMVNTKKIIRLNSKELKQYGYETYDGKATYLFTPESFNLKNHIDNVLKLLKVGDEIDKQMALKELNRYHKQYFFDESQLDLLVESLTSVNPDLTTKFLVTLKNYIINKGKEPKNKEALLQALRLILDKYNDPMGKSGHVRNVAICLLCHYKDEAILDQIVKDANSKINFQKAEEDYDPSSIAEIIVNNPSRLFETERQLMKEGKHNAAQFVSNIRGKSMKCLEMLDTTRKIEGHRQNIDIENSDKEVIF